MKMIVAIIQPTRLTAVQRALAQIGVHRMTISDATGFGRQRGQKESYRGVEYRIHLLRKVELQIAVNDDFLDRTVETIATAARTGPEGQIGDGKIFVLPLDEAHRVAGGSGPPAIN